MGDVATRFGLLLPHFGAEPESKRILELAARAEEAGFDSLWVRDRLIAGAPHGLLLEAGGTTFFEPLLTLAAVAAVTQGITLGTAILLPNRHPLQLMQQLGTLCRFAKGRVILGLGLGVGPANFESLGLDYENRKELFLEIVEAIGASPAGGPWSFTSDHFSFEDIEIDPSPPPEVPIYYGGVSRAAVRRAFQHGDGWIAGRLPADTFRHRMELVHQWQLDTGKQLDIATMPITLIDDGNGGYGEQTREAIEHLAQSAEGARDWIKPPSGRFETVEDLSGLLISGPPEVGVRESKRLLESGVTHLIFDLRLAFNDFEGQTDLLAQEVIPALR